MILLQASGFVNAILSRMLTKQKLCTWILREVKFVDRCKNFEITVYPNLAAKTVPILFSTVILRLSMSLGRQSKSSLWTMKLATFRFMCIFFKCPLTVAFVVVGVVRLAVPQQSSCPFLTDRFGDIVMIFSIAFTFAQILQSSFVTDESIYTSDNLGKHDLNKQYTSGTCIAL